MKYKVKPVRYWFPAVTNRQCGPGPMASRDGQPTDMQVCHQPFDTRIGNYYDVSNLEQEGRCKVEETHHYCGREKTEDTRVLPRATTCDQSFEAVLFR